MLRSKEICSSRRLRSTQPKSQAGMQLQNSKADGSLVGEKPTGSSKHGGNSRGAAMGIGTGKPGHGVIDLISISGRAVMGTIELAGRMVLVLQVAMGLQQQAARQVDDERPPRRMQSRRPNLSKLVATTTTARRRQKARFRNQGQGRKSFPSMMARHL